MAGQAQQLRAAWTQVEEATRAAWASGEPVQALANAVPYMQAFGHTVLAWIWLDVLLAAPADAPFATSSIASHAGRARAAAYFYHYELPKIGAWLNVVSSRDPTCAELPEEAF